MRFELLLVMIIFLCILLMCAELLWLYLLANNHDKERTEQKIDKEKCAKTLEAILYAPTVSARKNEEEQLYQMVVDNHSYMEIMTELYTDTLKKYGDMTTQEEQILVETIKKINPIPYYEQMLQENDLMKKSYACQKLGDLGAKDCVEEIRKLLHTKNRQLQYAAGISLAVLGDRQGVETFLLNLQEDYKYSYRIIDEIIDRYTGDLYLLVKELLEKGDTYIKSSMLKNIGKYQIEELMPNLVECVNDTDINIKIAATKALVYCAGESHMLTLLRLTKDQNWVVREFAVKALARFSTEEAIEAVKVATEDEQWWVRQAAAEALIQMDYSLEHIESVIKGYDRYASEAMKYSLYKVLNMEEKN